MTPNDQQSDALVAMLRCYLATPRVSWPYLALLLGALVLVVGGLFLPA